MALNELESVALDCGCDSRQVRSRLLYKPPGCDGREALRPPDRLARRTALLAAIEAWQASRPGTG